MIVEASIGTVVTREGVIRAGVHIETVLHEHAVIFGQPDGEYAIGATCGLRHEEADMDMFDCPVASNWVLVRSGE